VRGGYFSGNPGEKILFEKVFYASILEELTFQHGENLDIIWRTFSL
jgi:hypothetical protein